MPSSRAPAVIISLIESPAQSGFVILSGAKDLVFSCSYEILPGARLIPNPHQVWTQASRLGSRSERFSDPGVVDPREEKHPSPFKKGEEESSASFKTPFLKGDFGGI